MVDDVTNYSTKNGLARKLSLLISLSGEVENPCFRNAIQALAVELGVAGWARSTASGQMQLLLEGEAGVVRKMAADLQVNYLGSELEGVVVSRALPVGYKSFDIIGPERMRKIAPDHAEAMLFRARHLALEFQDLNLYIATLSRSILRDTASDAAGELAKSIPSRYLGEPLLTRQGKLPFKLTDVVGSFSSECWSHVIFSSELKRLKQPRPEAVLDNKINGKKFIEALGYKVPKTYQSRVQLDEIELRPGIVIKPQRGSGSNGVYSFLSENRIYNLGSNVLLHSFDEFLKNARRMSSRLSHDGEWIVEELILNDEGHLPNDLKMLTFYGKVAIIQEATRMPTRVCYYTREGERIRTGRYLHMEFEGTGVLPEYVQAAEEISLKIPAPFLRIDFLKSRNGPVFGEFTPRPGNFHKFDAETDAWLGGEFARARARLTADLLKGKRFLEFTRFVETLEAPAPLANAS